jgi:hypothetical protein
MNPKLRELPKQILEKKNLIGPPNPEPHTVLEASFPSTEQRG